MTKDFTFSILSRNRVRDSKGPSILRRWGTFGLGFAFILFFLFILGPQMARLPMIEPMAKLIDEKNIEAGMYFYTDVKAFSEARINIKNSMDFPPQQR